MKYTVDPLSANIEHRPGLSGSGLCSVLRDFGFAQMLRRRRVLTSSGLMGLSFLMALVKGT